MPLATSVCGEPCINILEVTKRSKEGTGNDIAYRPEFF